ncbi:hypothetical protein pdam_00002163, partial [Pocillopora damicornis]
LSHKLCKKSLSFFHLLYAFEAIIFSILHSKLTERCSENITFLASSTRALNSSFLAFSLFFLSCLSSSARVRTNFSKHCFRSFWVSSKNRGSNTIFGSSFSQAHFWLFGLQLQALQLAEPVLRRALIVAHLPLVPLLSLVHQGLHLYLHLLESCSLSLIYPILNSVDGCLLGGPLLTISSTLSLSSSSSGFSHMDSRVVGLKKNIFSSPVHTTHQLVPGIS